MNTKYKAFRTRLTNFLVKTYGGETASDTTSRYIKVFGCTIRISDHESPFSGKNVIYVICPLCNTSDIIIRTGLIVQVVHSLREVKIAIINMLRYIQLDQCTSSTLVDCNSENARLKQELQSLMRDSLSVKGLTPKQIKSLEKMIIGYLNGSN